MEQSQQPLSPADIPAVYSLLEAAVAQGPTGGNACEAAIEACSTRIGFCSCLLEIIGMPELRHNPDPRWLAAVYLKNSVNRYWRGRREALGISDAEKPLLRAKLMDLIPEPNPKVALQLALLTAKISRIDFPREWPGLIPSLRSRIESPDLLHSQRAALFLHHTLKELSSKRLGADQRNFAQLSSELFGSTWDAWMADTRTLGQGFTALFPPPHQHQHQQQQQQQHQQQGQQNGAAQAAPGLSEEEVGVMRLTCERWMLALKCLRRMLVFGNQSDFKSVQEVPAVKQMAAPLLEVTAAFLNLLSNAVAAQAASGAAPASSAAKVGEDFLRRALLKLMKTSVSMLETHPYSCASAGILLPLLEFTFANTTGQAHVWATPATPPPPPPAAAGEAGAAAGAGGGAPEAPGSLPLPPPPRATMVQAAAQGGDVGLVPPHVLLALEGFVPFRIQCMLVMQEVLKSIAYKALKSGRVVEDVLPSMELARGNLAELGRMQLRHFFHPARISFLADTLIRRYMVLSACDLQAWEQDPEGFFHEQDAIQWKEKLRPCSEALYLLLFESFREMLVPVVLCILREAMSGCPAPASRDGPVVVTPQLLLKEASYDAVGAASYDLHDHVDLESWYSSTLSLELACVHPNGRILRRKVAWLLGQWVSKIKASMRQSVYQALVALLADADLVVRLASCAALRALVDDVSFYEEEFLGFVEPSLSLLFRLLHDVSEFESQLLVVNLISLIIERVGDKVVPHAEKVLAQLPQVWERSEGESMLRIQVMLCLQRLVVALGPQSPLCYPILLPILQYSTDISQPDELNMLEDGLHLWSTSIRHAPRMEPAFMDLFANLVPVIDRGSDHLQVVLKLLEGYVLLGGAEFLQRYIGAVVHVLGQLVGHVRERGMMPVLGLVDLLVQCYPMEAPPALESVLQRVLALAVGPTEYSNLVRGMAACVLARVVFLNAPFFHSLLASAPVQQMLGEQAQQRGGAPPLLLFLDAWLDLVDSVPVAAKRKLSALALCTLLPMREPQVLDRMEQIISVCTSVIKEGSPPPEQTSVGHDFLGTSATDEFLGSSVECEYARRLQVAGGDLVTQVDVVLFVKEKLQGCQQAHGRDAVNTALSKVHTSMLTMLQLVS